MFSFKNHIPTQLMLLFLLNAVIWGQDSTNVVKDSTKSENLLELNKMTVVGTKTAKNKIESPGSVSLISKEDINASIAEHPFKALERTEGVWPRQYRGLADYWTRALFRGRRALVMVDGVNWNDYGYYVNPAAIPMNSIDRIDIVRGPYSALYGSMAQTAVINYITEKPEARQFDASLSYGSWNSRYASIGFGDRPGLSFPKISESIGDGLYYMFNFRYRNSDGYVTTPVFKTLTEEVSPIDSTVPFVSGWKKDTDPQTDKKRYEIGDQGRNWYNDFCMYFKTGYEFSENTDLWYSFNLSKFNNGWEDGRSYLEDENDKILYDGSVYLKDNGKVYNVSLSPSLFRADPKNKRSMVNTLNFSHSAPDLLDISALLAYSDHLSGTHILSSGRNKTEDCYLTQADVSATYHLLDNKILITGGVTEYEEGVTVKDQNLSDPTDAESEVTSTREEMSGKNRNLGAFLQTEISPFKFVSLYLGGRYDHWWGHSADYENADTSYNHPDVDRGKFSPKLSLVFKPLAFGQDTDIEGVIRASYGEAFTAPSLYYRVTSYYWSGAGSISMANPNPDLEPETNRSWEVGTEWNLWKKRINLKATYFENYFENLIVNSSKNTELADGTTLTEKKRINAEEAEVKGVELAVEASLPFDFRCGAFYAHNWSEYIKTYGDAKDGRELDETPTNMASGWLGYFGKYFEASITARYCDSRYDDEYAPYAEKNYKGDDEYYIADAKISVMPYKHLKLSLAVDNLLDYEYYEYYRGPGRFWQGTVEVSF